MTKSQQIAQLLLRPEGATYAEITNAIGWSSVSVPWHAKNNGLRLRTEKINGHGKRYFGVRRKIEVRKVVKPWQAPAPTAASEQKSELAFFCAAHDFAIHYNEGKHRVLRCIHCYLGFRIFQKNDSANPYLKRHLQQHARIHHSSYLARSMKEELHEQRGLFAE